MQNHRWLLTITVFLTLLISTSAQSKKAAPPTADQMVGTWIGLDDMGTRFTRVELNASGSGYYAVVAPANFITHDYGVQVYKIKRWTLNGWRISFDLSPLSSNAEPARMNGQIVVSSLQLEVRGVSRQWKMESTLHMESLLDGANKETKDAIANVQRK